LDVDFLKHTAVIQTMTMLIVQQDPSQPQLQTVFPLLSTLKVFLRKHNIQCSMLYSLWELCFVCLIVGAPMLRCKQFFTYWAAVTITGNRAAYLDLCLGSSLAL
jgi:hypothetical protein